MSSEGRMQHRHTWKRVLFVWYGCRRKGKCRTLDDDDDDGKASLTLPPLPVTVSYYFG